MPVYGSVPSFLVELGQAILRLPLRETDISSDRKFVEVFEDPDAKHTGFNIQGVSYMLPLSIWKQHYMRGPMPLPAALALWTADLRKIGVNFDPKAAVKKAFDTQQREAEHAAPPTAWAKLLTDDDEYPD